jgi:hypothetical protein
MPHEAMNLIALSQQRLCQTRAVLVREASDESFLRLSSTITAPIRRLGEALYMPGATGDRSLVLSSPVLDSRSYANHILKGLAQYV